MDKEKVLSVETISDYCRLLGVTPQHPLVTIADWSQLASLPHVYARLGFYCVFYKELTCGTFLYGRGEYDYQDGTLVFVAPGQIAGVKDGGVTQNPKGWALMFHPDFLYGTALAKQMKNFAYFSYSSNEALHMSEEERTIVFHCFQDILRELTNEIDKHTKHIVASNIETFLSHCVRFYERQFITREIPNHDILMRFETVLNSYLNSSKPRLQGLPSVQYCAEQVYLSPNYFGDLIKKETGKTAQEYIQQAIIDRAKELITEESRTISEVAFELGFKYPNHLNRIFKRVVGMTPGEFRHNAGWSRRGMVRGNALS